MSTHPVSALPRRWLLPAAVACLILAGGCSQSQRAGPYGDSQSRSGGSSFDEQRNRPPTARTLYTMAEILATQGKDKECEFVLRRCIQQHPNCLPAYNSLAELQMRQRRVREAVDVLHQALQVRPGDPVLLNNLGMCFLLHREYARALEHFTAAAGLSPISEKYRANMAATLGLMGRNEESLALLEQILPEEKARWNAEILHTAYQREVQPPGSPQS